MTKLKRMKIDGKEYYLIPVEKKGIDILFMRDSIKEALEACVGGFQHILNVAVAYSEQGKQWSRIDPNAAIAEMYASTNPITNARKVLQKIEYTQ